MTGAQRRQSDWTPEEDQRLLDLVETGKSWVFISANLKRPAKSAQDRLAYLGRQAVKAEFDTGPAEPGLKAKGK
jgi:Myb-like DNA-binding domain